MRKVNQHLLLGAVFILASCSASKNTEDSAEVRQDETSSMPTYLPDSPKTSVTVSHLVKDYDLWLKAFDDHDSIRTSAGITGATLYRGVSDSMMVVITAYTRDHESARAFFTDPELKGLMTATGVTSEPEITYWDIKWTRENKNIPDFDAFYMVSCGVESYDFWSEKYMEHDNQRVANGVFALLTATDADSVNRVGLYLGVVQLEEGNAMFADPAMEAIMKESGVLGQPIIYVVRPGNFFENQEDELNTKE